MKIYIAIGHDRHTDEIIKAYRNKDRAIQFCKDFADENQRSPGDLKEETIEGWVYYARYSTEDDFVRVEEVELSD